MQDKIFPLRMPKTLKAKLKKLADGRPLNTLINRILTQHVEDNKPKK